MKAGAIFLLVLAVALLIGWVTYPTSIPATSYSANRLSPGAYVELKRQMLAYQSANKSRGVSVRGDANTIGSIALYCKGVPLIVAANDPQAMSLLVFDAAHAPPPHLSALVGDLVLRLQMAGRFEARNAQQSGSGDLGRFVLKHRDGVDLDSSCEEGA